MKNLILILFFTVLTFAGFKCSKNDSNLPVDPIKEVITKANTACGSMNPDQSLQWLKDIVVKAEEDKGTKKHLGKYMGKIFLTSYQNRPVFYITMNMGSGGLAFYLFDCGGTTVRVSPNDDVLAFSQTAQKGELIYTNVPI